MSGIVRKLSIACADILLAGAFVIGNYIWEYRMPRKLDALNQQVTVETEGQPVPEQTGNVQGQPVPEQAGNAQGQSVPEQAGNVQEQERSAEVQPWKEKFRDHFTDAICVSDSSYSSPDVAVFIEQKTLGEGTDIVTYYVADIYIAGIDCIRTGFAEDTYGIGYREGLEEMSARFNAIAAISGDSYSNDSRMESGTIIRNGIVYRKESTRSDVCVLYYDGRMQTFSPEEFSPDQVIADGAYQTWIFGPALLDEKGKRKTDASDYNTEDYIRQSHPRTAIGYYEPGHYCMVLVDGRQEGYSRGMYLEEMSQIFEEMGCRAAYNLDGGHCSLMTFNGQIANQPYELSKDICDCIFIAEP
ncbi:MAG: phosphodiester glycosidase family protein [Lachnospiraceae bacterium]|nr:phosphodiester glycosidase family protein [Lachnospiraceae bacterium]